MRVLALSSRVEAEERNTPVWFLSRVEFNCVVFARVISATSVPDAQETNSFGNLADWPVGWWPGLW